MKKIRTVFTYNGTVVGNIDDDITINEMEKWREVMAYQCETTVSEIVVTLVEKKATDCLSNIQINENGKLIYGDIPKKEITGVRIGSDLTIERNLERFLDRIMEGTVDEVIFFTI